MDNLVSSIRHWRGRKLLKECIRKPVRNEIRSVTVLSECVEILEHCPELARERFPHHSLSNKLNIYPLIFLLMNGASLDSIVKVHSYYPQAICRKVTTRNAATDYPLHLVCGLENVSDDIISFLLDAHPEAATIKSSSGSLPIHVLFRNTCHAFSIKTIEYLLDSYENIRGSCWGDLHSRSSLDTHFRIAKGDWREGNNDYGAMLSLAIRNANVEPRILDYLVSRFPWQECDAFYLGQATCDFSVGFFLRQNTNYTITTDRLAPLCSLLPVLKIFSFTPKNVSKAAFLLLMTNLEKAPLVELTLSFPPTLFRDDDDSPSLALQRVVEKNKTLQRIHIDFPAHVRSMQVEELETVARKGFQRCLNLFLESLVNNSILKVCRLSGDLVSLVDSSFRSSVFWPKLANLLKSQNTTLERVSAGSFDHEHASSDMRQVEYFASLNRHGRARLQDPSIAIDQVLKVLASVQHSQERNSLMVVRILYGLLLDSPSTWANR